MVALSARTGGSRHTGLAALPHGNNHKSPVLYQGQHQANAIARKDKAPHRKGIFNLYFL